jgi:hypothetical protein
MSDRPEALSILEEALKPYYEALLFKEETLTLLVQAMTPWC